MKITKLTFLTVLLLVLAVVECYARPTVLETSVDYSGVETKPISLELYKEYDCNYSKKLYDYLKDYKAKPTWCQLRRKSDLREFKKELGIDLQYENINDKWLFVSFGCKMNGLEYWSNLRNYNGFDGLYNVKLNPDKVFSPNKIYVYKMEKRALREGNHHDASISFIAECNEYSIEDTTSDSNNYDIMELTLLEEGVLSKRDYLYGYLFLRDKNNKLPQICKFVQAFSNSGYESLRDYYGLPKFVYNNYKNKCIVISFGTKISGFKVFEDRVEAIPVGEYNIDSVYIYEADFFEIDLRQMDYYVYNPTENGKTEDDSVF